MRSWPFGRGRTHSTLPGGACAAGPDDRRNRAIDRIRRARPTDDIADVDATGRLRTTPNPVWEQAVRSLDRDALRGALDSLPDEQRQAVELAYFGGNTYREVAELKYVAPGTAASRLRLAVARLRATLEPDR